MDKHKYDKYEGVHAYYCPDCDKYFGGEVDPEDGGDPEGRDVEYANFDEDGERYFGPCTPSQLDDAVPCCPICGSPDIWEVDVKEGLNQQMEDKEATEKAYQQKVAMVADKKADNAAEANV